VGVGSGRCGAVLSGNDAMGAVEKPGPSTLIEGATGLMGCKGGSKLMAGATVREGRTGGLDMADGPLTLTDGLFMGVGTGSVLIVGAAGKTGMAEAISGSSDSTMLGTLGSSGTMIVGIVGIGEVDLPEALIIGVGTCGIRYPLSRGGSIFGIACLLKGDDRGVSDTLEVRGGVMEADGVDAIAGTRVSSRTISFVCFQL
jgi:hypothetical protein